MKDALEQILSGRSLTENQSEALLAGLIAPDTHPEMIAAVLVALRAKGENPDEVRGFASAMRKNAVRPHIPTRDCVDVVGTGGDGSGSLNLSTGVALLTASCGLPVVKHGNAAISSRSGSADVLRELGLGIPLNPEEAVDLFERIGFTFLFAPLYHPAMATIAPVRKRLGIRSIFNILGPLTNPAAPRYSVIGAFSLGVAELMAEALSGMDLQRVFVIHGAAGWDEPTPIGAFHLFDVRPGSVSHTTRDPEDYGLPRCVPEDLAGGNAAHNASELGRVLNGERGHHRHALTLGAALALEVAGRCDTPEEGLKIANIAIDSGAAGRLLKGIGAEVPGSAEVN